MAPKASSAQGTKRSRDGSKKVANPEASTLSQPQLNTPPCAQPAKEPITSSISLSETPLHIPGSGKTAQKPAETTKPSKPSTTHTPSTKPPTETKQKRPRLPDNATITKRPLLHPAVPTPFSSSHQPKTVYIKPTSPFIPSVKRVRTLLREIEKRHRQSLAAQKRSGLGSRDPLRSDGRLDPKVVERAIAEGGGEFVGGGGSSGGGGKSGIGQEEVFVMASGKAIPRALEIGNWFQKEGDCGVRVEIGSVSAIDDIGVVKVDSEFQGAGKVDDAMDVDGVEEEVGDKRKRKKNSRIAAEEDIPETRIRTLSTVAVAISLK